MERSDVISNSLESIPRSPEAFYGLRQLQNALLVLLDSDSHYDGVPDFVPNHDSGWPPDWVRIS